jgi:predicted amidophosphoribosyltransferase
MADTTCPTCWVRLVDGPDACPLCGTPTTPSVRLIRHQGEMLKPDDTASVDEWGHFSWG